MMPGPVDDAPLGAIFPGEAVDVPSLGRVLTVTPWGAKAAVHEIPVLLGRIVARLVPVLDQLRTGADPVETLPTVLQGAAREVYDLVVWSVRLTAEEQERLSLADAVRVFRAVLRVNRDFFAELAAAWDDVTRVALAENGPRSPSSSDALAGA
jgi:hypothetical protein